MNEEDVWDIYNGTLLSHEKDLPFSTTQIDLQGLKLNEINRTEKDK